jgi:hypothetical protein
MLTQISSLTLYVFLIIYEHKTAQRKAVNAAIRMEDLQNRRTDYATGPSPALENTVHSLERPETARVWA